MISSKNKKTFIVKLSRPYAKKRSGFVIRKTGDVSLSAQDGKHNYNFFRSDKELNANALYAAFVDGDLLLKNGREVAVWRG